LWCGAGAVPLRPARRPDRAVDADSWRWPERMAVRVLDESGRGRRGSG
jgi:hypothetical protein